MKRWSEFLPQFAACAFMAVQSYAASRRWGVSDRNTISVVAFSVLGAVFLLGLAMRRGLHNRLV